MTYFSMPRMNWNLSLFAIAGLFLSNMVFAANDPLPECSSLQHPVAPGIRCKTSKGATFQRLTYGWLDERMSTIWYDEVKNNLTAFEAKEFCVSRGLQFTKYDTYVTSVLRGLKEVFRDMEDKYFWTDEFSEFSFMAIVVQGSGEGLGPKLWQDTDKRDARVYVRCMKR